MKLRDCTCLIAHRENSNFLMNLQHSGDYSFVIGQV